MSDYEIKGVVIVTVMLLAVIVGALIGHELRSNRR